MPTASKMLLAGDLGCFGPEWTGWHIRDGLLTSPEGWQASVGDVMSIQLTQAQLATYRAENRALKAELQLIDEAMEDQPAPDQWEIASA